MKHKHLMNTLLTLSIFLGAAARFWSLSAAVDSQGLPVTDHPATICLIASAVLFVLLFLILSIKSPGRGASHDVLAYSSLQSGLAQAGAGLLLLGTMISLFSSSGTAALVLFLLGAASAICMLFAARLHRRGSRMPLPELVPVVYLVVKLVLNFKNWSTDPIILDYFDLLFALIFTLLAFYGSAGFVFDQGRPRKTLFYAAAALLFCAMAAISSVMKLDVGSAVAYVGYLVWLLPVAECMLVPHEAPPKPEKPEGSEL